MNREELEKLAVETATKLGAYNPQYVEVCLVFYDAVQAKNEPVAWIVQDATNPALFLARAKPEYFTTAESKGAVPVFTTPPAPSVPVEEAREMIERLRYQERYTEGIVSVTLDDAADMFERLIGEK